MCLCCQVHDYIRSYLGESKQVETFAQQFLEKRSKLKNAAKPTKHEVMQSYSDPSVKQAIVQLKMMFTLG